MSYKTGTRRIILGICEIIFHDLVNRIKISNILQIDCPLYDIVDGLALRRKKSFDVLEDPVRLCTNIPVMEDLTRLEVLGCLPGRKN